MRLARLVFRAALWAIPRGMRERQGEAMEGLFETNYVEALKSGRMPACRVTAAAAFDALTFGVVHRWSVLSWRARRGANPKGAWRAASSWEALSTEAVHALRSLRRAPRYMLMSTLTLALGIGANSAIFSVVKEVMLQPLPFENPEEVVHIAWERRDGVSGWLTAWQYEFWRDNTDVFSTTTTYRPFSTTLGAEDSGPSLFGLRVSHQFLDVVGIQPALGRPFVASDDERGAPLTVILGHSVWRDRLGSDPNVIGQTFVMGKEIRTIIGVLPDDFSFPQEDAHSNPLGDSRTKALIPLVLKADLLDEGENYPFLARLRDNVTPATADAQVRSLTEVFRQAHPQLLLGSTMRLSSFQELFVGGLRTTLTVLMFAVGLVWLIACANVANLSLVRAVGRRREMAMRSALGATRRRLTSQALIESLVVAGLGGLIGLAVAPLATNALLTLSPAQLPRLDRITLDWAMVGYTLVATLITGLAVGLISTQPVSSRSPSDILKKGSRGSTEHGQARQVFLVFETALTMVLLVGAGLLISTLRELHQVDTGFERDGLLTVRFDGALPGYNNAQAVAVLEDRLIAELTHHPSVKAVAGASSLPLERGMNIPVTLLGQPESSRTVEWRAITPTYLKTLGATLVQGRSFTADDNAPDAPRVAIINQAFSAQFFGGENPVGQEVEIGKYRDRFIHPDFSGPAVRIVGVMTNVRDRSLKNEASRTILVPQAQAQDRMTSPPAFLIRTTQPRNVAGLVRAAMANADPNLPPPTIRRMEAVVAQSIAYERFNAALMSAFAALALLLTVIGIYGVVAYDARRRAQENGIRMALGASGNAILRLTLVRGMRPVLAGLAIGTMATFALSRLIRSMLWGVNSIDPVTTTAVAAILTVTALLASFLPARESARSDPGATLRR